MRVCEYCKEVYLREGNVPIVLNVESHSIRAEFSHVYKGDVIEYGGVSGRISDIPSYLGDYEILKVEESEERSVITGDLKKRVIYI